MRWYVLLFSILFVQQQSVFALEVGKCWPTDARQAKMYAPSYKMAQFTDLIKANTFAVQKRSYVIKEKDKEIYTIIYLNGYKTPEIAFNCLPAIEE